MVGPSRELSRHFMPEASLSGEEGLAATDDMQGGSRVVREIVSCAQPPQHSLGLHDKPREPTDSGCVRYEPSRTNASQHAEILSKRSVV